MIEHLHRATALVRRERICRAATSRGILDEHLLPNQIFDVPKRSVAGTCCEFGHMDVVNLPSNPLSSRFTRFRCRPLNSTPSKCSQKRALFNTDARIVSAASLCTHKMR